MTLSAGTKLGRYEIRSKIGAEGMGEALPDNQRHAARFEDSKQELEFERKLDRSIKPSSAGAAATIKGRPRNDVGIHQQLIAVNNELLTWSYGGMTNF